MSQTVHGIDHRVDTNELRAALEQTLSEHFGSWQRIARLERCPSLSASSYLLEELTVVLESGECLSIMFKNVGRHGMMPDARQAKPEFIHDPMREITIYRDALAALDLAPTCFGTVADARHDRFWLFLERVPGVDLWQVGEFEVWQQVARWLARAHKCLADRIALDKGYHLLRYDEEFYWLWPRRAATFATGDVKSEIEWLMSRYGSVVERLLALPANPIHGEFFASNILVRQGASGVQVCAIDWEMAAVGPGLMDLAALTSGVWTELERAAIAIPYYEVLVQDGNWQPTQKDFMTALDCCRMHLSFQWLGWSQHWTPPQKRAHDWLGEARRAAERLEL